MKDADIWLGLCADTNRSNRESWTKSASQRSLLSQGAAIVAISSPFVIMSKESSLRSWPTLASPFGRQSLAKPTLASVSVLVVWPTLAKTDFGQTDFGQTEFDLWLCVCLCVCVFVCVLCGVGVGFTVSWCGVSRVGVGFKVLVWSCSVPPGSPFPGTPFPWTAQNFALFSLSRR